MENDKVLAVIMSDETAKHLHEIKQMTGFESQEEVIVEALKIYNTVLKVKATGGKFLAGNDEHGMIEIFKLGEE